MQVKYFIPTSLRIAVIRLRNVRFFKRNVKKFKRKKNLLEIGLLIILLATFNACKIGQVECDKA